VFCLHHAYVDDIILISFSIAAPNHLLAGLSGDFAVKDSLHYFLSLKVIQSYGRLTLTP
jgi:hypothetical protein